jgi:hypothetical protein
MIAQMGVQVILALKVRMLELVDRISLSFIDNIVNVQVVFRITYLLNRPIRPEVKTELFQCLNKGSNPLWVKTNIEGI